jgi:hypothetical protein
MPDNREKLQ